MNEVISFPFWALIIPSFMLWAKVYAPTKIGLEKYTDLHRSHPVQEIHKKITKVHAENAQFSAKKKIEN